MTTFDIFPLGPDFPITVMGNKSKYLRDLNMGKYENHTFRVVAMATHTRDLLFRSATQRYAGRLEWYAYCNGACMSYNYRKNRLTGVRYIDVNTYANYRGARG